MSANIENDQQNQPEPNNNDSEKEKQLQTEAEKKKQEEAAKRAPPPQPRSDNEPEKEDELLNDIFLDYKAQLGDRYDKNLDKEPLRNRVKILRQAVKLIGSEAQAKEPVRGAQQAPPTKKLPPKTLLEINNPRDYQKQLRSKNSHLNNSLKWRGVNRNGARTDSN